MEMSLNGYYPSFSAFALTYLPYLVIFNEARLQNNVGFKESVHPSARQWPDIALLFFLVETRVHVNIYLYVHNTRYRCFILNYGYLKWYVSIY